VRAPLADLLDDDERPLAPAQRARVELVQRNAERLLRLVDGLLEFSRAADAARELEPEPIDLVAFTRELVSLFVPAAEQGGIDLELRCEGDRAAVLVDRDAW